MTDNLYVVSTGDSSPFSLVPLPEIIQGEKGDKGDPGEKGDPGSSAYVPTFVSYRLNARGDLVVGELYDDIFGLQDQAVYAMVARIKTPPTYPETIELDVKINGTSIISAGTADPFLVPDPSAPTASGGPYTYLQAVWLVTDIETIPVIGEADVLTAEITTVGTTIPGADLKLDVFVLPKDALALL